MEEQIDYRGYLVIFNKVDRNGMLYTKDSFKDSDLEILKKNGTIMSYEKDEIGIKITKHGEKITKII